MSFLKSLFGVSDNSDAASARQQESDRNFDILKYDGIRALRQGDGDYAVKCLTHALQIKDDGECREHLANAYLQQGDPTAALGQMNVLAESEPDNSALLLRKAEVAYLADAYDVVADTCMTILELAPDNSRACLLYGRAFMAQGNDIQAIAMLTKAISIDEDCLDAYLLRGGLLMKLGDLDGAGADASLLVGKVPDSEDAQLLSARVTAARGQHQEAIEIYNKVIDLNPFCVEAFRERGAIRLALGDKDGAEADMRQVLELSPHELDATSGDFTAEGREGIQCKVEQNYRNMNPYGF